MNKGDSFESPQPDSMYASCDFAVQQLCNTFQCLHWVYSPPTGHYHLTADAAAAEKKKKKKNHTVHTHTQKNTGVRLDKCCFRLMNSGLSLTRIP